MKMLLQCLSRVIRESVKRFRDKVERQLKIGARSDAKPVPTFADRAPGLSGRLRENENEY
jgi:hypothetical protein